jgi:hypothetical protein
MPLHLLGGGRAVRAGVFDGPLHFATRRPERRGATCGSRGARGMERPDDLLHQRPAPIAQAATCAIIRGRRFCGRFDKVRCRDRDIGILSDGRAVDPRLTGRFGGDSECDRYAYNRGDPERPQPRRRTGIGGGGSQVAEAAAPVSDPRPRPTSAARRA